MDNQQDNGHEATDATPPAHRTILVHKKDAEGALIINALSGLVQQDMDERPDWAEGITCALLTERHKFYTDRLGTETFSHALQFPQAIAFEDLGWVGVNEDGEPVELEADAEHRMDNLAELLGVDREALEGSEWPAHSKGGKVLAEVTIAMDKARTAEEAKAIEDAQQEGFGQKTGTHEG